MRDTVDVAPGRVERDVEQIIFPASALWHGLAQRPQQSLSDRVRKPFEATPLAVGDITRIARKKLVAAISGKNDGHVIACELRNHVCRQSARIRKLLIKMPNENV